jgi:hypothetical protein
MKLQAPTGTTGELHLNGRAFVIDNKGQVDVPEHLLGSSIWAKGYTVVPPKDSSKPVTSDVASKDKV